MLAIRRTALGSLLALSFVALMAGAVVAEETGPTHDQFAAALARAQAENKPVVLDFFTDW